MGVPSTGKGDDRLEVGVHMGEATIDGKGKNPHTVTRVGGGG